LNNWPDRRLLDLFGIELPVDAVRSLHWRARLAPYYLELGLDPEIALPAAARRPFDGSIDPAARARGPGKACAIICAGRPIRLT
jgi:hypothetical protein